MATTSTSTRKTVPMSSVHDDVISMEFSENPNIPTANYSEETAKLIQSVIAKKKKAEKLKTLIENELKNVKKPEEGEMIGLGFKFSSM